MNVIRVRDAHIFCSGREKRTSGRFWAPRHTYAG
jgi:hypothetical protein